MTVSSRKKDTTIKDEEKPNVLQTGIQYNCDFCHSDITHTVRIKCAATGCEEVDLCPSCFCKGKEAGKHKRWHPYKVVEQHSYPIFTESWGADEELLLIEGLTLFGLGNWQDAAEHVGTRTREECEEHYIEVWVGKGEKEQGVAKKANLKFEIDTETFQARKKRRIEDMRTQTKELPNPQNSKPLVSAPTNHEIGGYMPGRLDFEHEVHDEAENAVKDMEFALVFQYGGDEQPGDEDVVLAGGAIAKDSTSTTTRETVGVGDTGSSRNAVASGIGTSGMDVDGEAGESSSLVSHRGLGSGSATAGKASGAKIAASSSKQPPSAIPPHLRGETSFNSPTPEPEDSLSPGSAFASPPPQPPSSAAASSSSLLPPPPPSTPLSTTPTTSTKAPTKASPSSFDPNAPLPFSSLDPLPFSDSPNSSAPLPFSDQTPLPFATEPPAPIPPPPPPPPPPLPVNTDSPDYPEDPDDLELKLAVLDIYNDKLDRRKEAKNILFQRGLMEHKKIIAAEKKKPQRERDLIAKYKVFAKLQTAEDHEVFIEGLLYEQTLRTRITQLQNYRSKGITTVAEAERYEAQLEYRNSGIVDPKGRGPGGRFSLGPGDVPKSGRESREGSTPRSAYTPVVGGRKAPAPLNLATAASLHLLSPTEQELCSTLRILPKPYLMIKETLIREYARRGGNLRRREARGLVKIDVNKTARIWDLMEEMGVFKAALDPNSAKTSPPVVAVTDTPPPPPPAAEVEGGTDAPTPAVEGAESAADGLPPVLEEPSTATIDANTDTIAAPTEAAVEPPPPSEVPAVEGMDGVVMEVV